MTNSNYLIRCIVESGMPIATISLHTGVEQHLIKKILRGYDHTFSYKKFRKILALWCKLNNLRTNENERRFATGFIN